MTYGFKNDGRKRDPQPLEPKGKDLLPGAYSIDDFAQKYATVNDGNDPIEFLRLFSGCIDSQLRTVSKVHNEKTC